MSKIAGWEKFCYTEIEKHKKTFEDRAKDFDDKTYMFYLAEHYFQVKQFLLDTIDIYGWVSVGDFLDYCEAKPEGYLDYQVGWRYGSDFSFDDIKQTIRISTAPQYVDKLFSKEDSQ